MNISRALPAFVLTLTGLSGCATDEAEPARPAACSDAWYAFVDEHIETGDGMGHGPDAGSEEWQSVIEFKLGVRDSAEVPDRSTEAWCLYIDAQV